jgi:hypothetical protein
MPETLPQAIQGVSWQDGWSMRSQSEGRRAALGIAESILRALSL